MKVAKNSRKAEVVTYRVEEVYTLELNKDEATALMALVGTVSGHRETNNVRTVTDRIYNGLKDAGISFLGNPDVDNYTASFKGAVVLDA